MAVNRRIFTDEFKAEAVRLVTVEGHPARQVARDLDIHESLLRRWQRINWQLAKPERLE